MARKIIANIALGAAALALALVPFCNDFSSAKNLEGKASEEPYLIEAAPQTFSDSTKISYVLPEERDVTLNVYDLKGEKVSTLVSGEHSPGIYSVNFSCDTCPNGTYFVVLKSEGFMHARNMTLQR